MGTLVFLLMAAALVAFWLRQWQYGSTAGGMTNRAIALWSLALSLPVQYGWMLASVVLTGDPFGCSNFHGSTLTPCSFAEMLMNLLTALFLVNVLSFGIVFLFVAAVIGAVLLGWRRWRGGHSDMESSA